MKRYTFRCYATGTFRRTGTVDAETEEEARRLFYAGECAFDDDELEASYIGDAELRHEKEITP